MNQEISTLLENQQQVGLEITKSYELFKKEGRKRRNKLERLNYWRSRIDAEWIKFVNNHAKIIEKEDGLKEETYFKEDYYNFIKLFVDEMTTTIKLKENLEKRKTAPITSNKWNQTTMIRTQ